MVMSNKVRAGILSVVALVTLFGGLELSCPRQVLSFDQTDFALSQKARDNPFIRFLEKLYLEYLDHLESGKSAETYRHKYFDAEVSRMVKVYENDLKKLDKLILGSMEVELKKAVQKQRNAIEVELETLKRLLEDKKINHNEYLIAADRYRALDEIFDPIKPGFDRDATFLHSYQGKESLDDHSRELGRFTSAPRPATFRELWTYKGAESDGVLRFPTFNKLDSDHFINANHLPIAYYGLTEENAPADTVLRPRYEFFRHDSEHNVVSFGPKWWPTIRKKFETGLSVGNFSELRSEIAIRKTEILDLRAPPGSLSPKQRQRESVLLFQTIHELQIPWQNKGSAEIPFRKGEILKYMKAHEDEIIQGIKFFLFAEPGHLTAPQFFREFYSPDLYLGQTKEIFFDSLKADLRRIISTGAIAPIPTKDCVEVIGIIRNRP